MENTGLIPGLEFPNAQYIATDFHCERSLSSWTDPFQLNNGWLSGLADLDTESDYVRERIAAYMTDIISIGFSGYRIDAAKHIQPDSIAAIFAKVKRNLGGGDLPADFISWLEVLIGGEKDLLFCGEGDYSYGQSFANKMKAAGLSDADVQKVKIWSSDYPKEFPICGYWETPAEREVIQNDCHDDQNPGSSSRDMGDKGSVYCVNEHIKLNKLYQMERGITKLLYSQEKSMLFSITEDLMLGQYALKSDIEAKNIITVKLNGRSHDFDFTWIGPTLLGYVSGESIIR